jgi:ABC-type multidrug transport system ATPase subunit
LSFTLDGWTVLGRKVSVSLLDRVAVLVGRNGAGKSAILEGLKAISSLVIGNSKPSPNFDIDRIPKKLDIEILTPTERRLQYTYELVVVSTSIDDSFDSAVDDSATDILEENLLIPWNECCQYLDEAQEVLWKIESGVTTISNSEVTHPGGINSLRELKVRLRFEKIPGLKLLDEMEWVYSILSGISLLGKTPIRIDSRGPSVVRVVNKRVFSTSAHIYAGGEVDTLAKKIVSMEAEEFDELESLCQRVGLGSKLTIENFFSRELRELSERVKRRTKAKNEANYFAAVSLDEVNIGLLSDGTLRVLSLLIELISSPPSATTIIEEPETQIHPGMLAKLLNEIETYTSGDNLILSTHSPQVVAWTTPDKINLVYRNNGQTIIRKLGEAEILKVVEYLYEEGNLGEWLYSGILDE